jgi:hypothetical protein
VRRPFDAPVVTDYSTASVSSFAPQVRRYLRGSFFTLMSFESAATLLVGQDLTLLLLLNPLLVGARIFLSAHGGHSFSPRETPLINPVFAQLEAVLPLPLP